MTKLQEVSGSTVAYQNDPEEAVTAIRSILSGPMRICCTVVENSPTAELLPCVTESGAEAAMMHGDANGSYSHGKLLKHPLQPAIEYFGKWGWIYDSGQRRLNERSAALTRDHAVRESAA